MGEFSSKAETGTPPHSATASKRLCTSFPCTTTETLVRRSYHTKSPKATLSARGRAATPRRMPQNTLFPTGAVREIELTGRAVIEIGAPSVGHRGKAAYYSVPRALTAARARLSPLAHRRASLEAHPKQTRAAGWPLAASLGRLPLGGINATLRAVGAMRQQKDPAPRARTELAAPATCTGLRRSPVAPLSAQIRPADKPVAPSLDRFALGSGGSALAALRRIRGRGSS